MQNVNFIKKESFSELDKLLKDKLKGVFNKNDRVAVKLHMGEAGNKHFVKPEIVKIAVNVLKECGANPFLFDSPVVYNGSRDTPGKYLQTAKKHGFSEQSIGCPIVISDAPVIVKTQNLEIEVCRDLSEADGLFVISHVKGHMCSGFGAAIKNLGMGGVSVKSKKDIHILSQAVLNGKCLLCGNCVSSCPVGAISIKNNKIVIDYDFGCWGCGKCIISCPHNALKNRKAPFEQLIAESASAVLKNHNKAFFMNVITEVTALCDCCSDPGAILIGDIGIVLSKDIVAADKASFDLINKKAGKDLFKEYHKKSPLGHILAAEKLGVGASKYNLIQ